MKQLITIKNIPLEIATQLAQDQVLVQLVVDDQDQVTSGDNDSGYTLETLLSKKYFCTYPIVETDGLPTSTAANTRNTFLVIKLTLINFDDNNSVAVSGNIYVSTNRNHYLLTGGHDRPLEICDRICQDLDGLKITATQTIQINNIVSIVVGVDRAGYCIDFTVRDQFSANGENAAPIVKAEI